MPFLKTKEAPKYLLETYTTISHKSGLWLICWFIVEFISQSNVHQARKKKKRILPKLG